MAAHHHIYMLLGNQALCLRSSGGSITCMITADNFQRAAVDAAGCIDLSHCKIDTAQNVGADGGGSAGHRIDRTDSDRLTGKLCTGLSSCSFASCGLSLSLGCCLRCSRGRRRGSRCCGACA